VMGAATLATLYWVEYGRLFGEGPSQPRR
jgi:hypothetical protein